MAESSKVDIGFVRALPKAELHAHLSGSISRETLHAVWLYKQSKGECLDLEDPLTAIKTGLNGFVDVVSFFPVFDKYIYSLCDDTPAVKYVTKKVIRDFEADGVKYLELRTTPRRCEQTGMGTEEYAAAVNEVVHLWNESNRDRIEVYLIFSIDRQMTAEQAMQVVHLAIKHKHYPNSKSGCVVGIDLCGNPVKQQDVSIFTLAFEKAREFGFGITAHFAEVPQSSTDHELATILSWKPTRLGHCIYVPYNVKEIIRSRCLGLELCISCNVLAGLTTGGFEDHHFKYWITKDCPVALSTDDIGIFGSRLSNEYLLVAKYFSLSKETVVELSRQAIRAAFSGKKRMMGLIDQFVEGRTEESIKIGHTTIQQTAMHQP